MEILKAITKATAKSAVNSYENRQLKKNHQKAYETTGKKLNGKGKSRKTYQATYAKTKADLDR